MDIVFATNNKNKLKEIRNILDKSINIISLEEIGCRDDIPETQDTLEGNAAQKARYIYEKYGKNCFADDTGLEVEALNNEPGVYSARYAGEKCLAEDNIIKLLKNLEGIENRKAQFRTSICLIINGEEFFFNGDVQGDILCEEHGIDGFGYDPIFKPLGYEISFAEMDMKEKNKISHRGKACIKLAEYLNKL
ncbi:non-canonical purine NTP diphosphatase [Marinilabiliaceae bacterium JC040]|nr:non-canonical purine NTP diphosphatase [Marinilabiliaceae bacterium JC040]